MARYTGPKDKLSRREGVDLFGKGAKLTRINVLPGVHGPKGQVRSQSQFGKQLREKQKVKRMYGLMEKQFRKYVEIALKAKGNTGEVLLVELERRLDNVVYRLGFANTRNFARQLVSHRHIDVNGKRVNIASFKVKPGDVVSISAKALNIPGIIKALKDTDYLPPSWLERKTSVGKVLRLPIRDDVKEEIVESDIVEYYSR